MTDVIIRPVTLEDVEALMGHWIEIASEPGIYVNYTPEEAAVPAEKERERIEKDIQLGNLRLIVEVQGKVIGYFSCISERYYSITQHMAVLGMSLDRNYRNQGIGTGLMEQGIRWSQENGIVRLELEVYAENAPALHLYEKFGFELEGRKRMCAYQRGQYYDLLIMARLFV